MNKLSNLSNERKIVYIFLILCSILFVVILPLGQDLNFHLYRIGAMAEQLKLSHFKIPIRMLSTSFDGYGYAVPLFYGDTFLYIPALLVCLGMKVNAAYRLLMVSVFALVFFSSRFSIRRVSEDEDYSFYFAVTYTFASYFLIDLCIRMALGEAISFIFIPVVFASMYGIVNKRNKYDWVYLSLGMAGIIACHNLTAVFATIILIIYLICVLVSNKGENIGYILTSTVKAALLFVGISASFIFPFIEAIFYQKYQTPSSGDPDHVEYFAKHTLDLFDFFFPYELKKAVSSVLSTNFDLDIWAPGAVGLILILILILRIKMGRCNSRLLVSGQTVATVAYGVLFITPAMRLLAKYLAFMQFGWRIISFCTFFWCLYLAYYLSKIESDKVRILTIVLVILLGLFSIAARYAYQTYISIRGQDYIESINPEYADNYRMEYSPNKGDNLYLPEGTNYYTFEERGTVVLSDYDCQYDYYRDGNNSLVLDISCPLTQDTTFECPLYIYKGYEAVDENGNEFDIVRSVNNLVSVMVPAEYSGIIIVAYTGTTIQKISDYISLIALIMLVLNVTILKLKNTNLIGGKNAK